MTTIQIKLFWFHFPIPQSDGRRGWDDKLCIFSYPQLCSETSSIQSWKFLSAAISASCWKPSSTASETSSKPVCEFFQINKIIKYLHQTEVSSTQRSSIRTNNCCSTYYPRSYNRVDYLYWYTTPVSTITQFSLSLSKKSDIFGQIEIGNHHIS